MPEDPRPIAPQGRYVVNRKLALTAHADAVSEVRDRHRRCKLEMIAHEVRIMAFDVFSPRLAEVAAKNNLAVRLKDLDAEPEAELKRLQVELQRKLQRPLENLEDSTTEIEVLAGVAEVFGG
jgi:hypothetical protein